jgi:hypothetical protein
VIYAKSLSEDGKLRDILGRIRKYEYYLQLHPDKLSISVQRFVI